ncbi:GTPase Era [Roseisolibacter sp. H3M3-2]|uniref:GTPase Era n=1 Tax=Roseisolibacter sp. H3M3-2 TaxID=3031323 RepID=UPI0023DAA948|nr:GTPase Era [Roseisolibacter sp. H3M3-2]MDF1506116.1 GTPase Era [Roseisolibacter sp. H3M3-2]
MPRAGIVTVVGKPNAGKSTLLNRVVGQKLAITSPKPQSTRDRVVGIRSEEGVQMVVLDTPGLLEPRYALHAAMRGAAIAALRDADVVVYLVDATEGTVPPLETVAALTDAERPRAPVLLALNKLDALEPARREALRAEYPDAFLVSALDGSGVDALLAAAAERLPESPFLYPEDEISTQTLRFFAAELVRETALEQLDDEVPYSVACEIEEFRESRSPVYIRAVLHVERDSQKRILIGAKGTRIREIGRVARAKIEALLEAQVYLDLWVKVLPNWRRDERALRRLGYQLPPDPDA